MSFSVVHDSVAPDRARKRASVLTRTTLSDAAPIPPTLVNSPHLSSPNSVFRRKTSVPRWPSQRDDDWLRDMVPIAPSDADTQSDSTTPSPTSSEFGSLLFPPSPMLRPRSASPDAPRRLPGGSGSVTGQSPHD